MVTRSRSRSAFARSPPQLVRQTAIRKVRIAPESHARARKCHLDTRVTYLYWVNTGRATPPEHHFSASAGEDRVLPFELDLEDVLE